LQVLPPGQNPTPDSLSWESIQGAFVEVQKAPGSKCIRCWFTYHSVGEDPGHPQICARCRQVLEG
jgi:isoleucyl-tRNA synthetase